MIDTSDTSPSFLSSLPSQPITDFPGEVRYPSPKGVYERDLKRNRDLNQTIDPTPSEAFKRYGTLDIAGNIAVVDDEGTVQWALMRPGYADGYGPEAESQQPWTFWKPSPLLRATGSVSSVFTYWTVARHFV